jgi:hypothetical protein
MIFFKATGIAAISIDRHVVPSVSNKEMDYIRTEAPFAGANALKMEARALFSRDYNRCR